MKFMRILKSTALGFFLACLAFMFLVRGVDVDDNLAGATFFVLWPILSFVLWKMFRRQEISTKAATASSKPKPRFTNGKRLALTFGRRCGGSHDKDDSEHGCRVQAIQTGGARVCVNPTWRIPRFGNREARKAEVGQVRRRSAPQRLQ